MNTTTNNNSISVSQLSKSFGRKSVLKNLSFNIPENSIAGFLGPNGSGKTTTLRILLGLLPAKGDISLLGNKIPDNRTKAIEQIGAVVENPNFIEGMTAKENLFWFGSLFKPVSDTRIMETIEMVGLKDAAKQKFGLFSSGMKQRLGVAFGILHKPKLLILDEPTSGMDPMGRMQMREILQRIHSEEKTSIFLSSHLLDEIQRLCNYVVIINDGVTKKEGFVSELLSEKKERWEIRIKDEEIEKAREILLGMNENVTNIADTPQGLLITLTGIKSSLINTKLVENNIKISALIPKEASLEEAFITLTDSTQGQNL